MKKLIQIIIGLLIIVPALFLILPASKLKAGDIPVLTYHKIFDEEGTFSVSPENFKKMIDELSRRDFTFLTVDDLSKIIQGRKKLPLKPVLITFDDGYEDNYTNAFPILKSYGAKASIFLIGSLVDKPGYLTWDMVSEMSYINLMDFQNHTFDQHAKIEEGKNKDKTKFSSRYENESEEEYLKRIKDDLIWNNWLIYQHTSKYPLALAYPGAASNDSVRKILKDAGIKIAFVGANKRASNIKNLNPYEIRRFHIKNATDIEKFVNKIEYNK